jgi:hypothetical protein
VIGAIPEQTKGTYRRKTGGTFSELVLPRRAVLHESVAAFGAAHASLVARSIKMLDLIMLAIGLAFFALSVGYTIACDRL